MALRTDFSLAIPVIASACRSSGMQRLKPPEKGDAVLFINGLSMMLHSEPAPASGGSTQILDEATEILIGLYGKELEHICIERLIVGVFCAGVKLTSGHSGIAYTPPEAVQRAGTRILKGHKPLIRGMRASELIAGGVLGPFSDVIRLATLNALSVPFLNRDRYIVGAGDDVTDHSQFFVDKKICMVGAIIPTLKRLQELGIQNVTIIDKKEATRAESDFGNFIPIEKTAEALALCETAIFTGASIANGTIEYLISNVSEKAAIVVVGPTAGFVPEPLFRRNVALVGTVAVTDSDLALDLLSEGGGAYQLFKKCLRKIILINPNVSH
jgi:uncharacterized protein